MAGGILIALGLARLGGAIKFIPFPVVTGFTSGIALIIFSGEIKDLFGLPMGDVPPGFIDKWRAYGERIGEINPPAALVSAIALIIFSGEIKDLFGLPMGDVPPGFIDKWRAYGERIGEINPHAALVSAIALLILVLWPRLSRRIPGPFVALIVTTALVHLFGL